MLKIRSFTIFIFYHKAIPSAIIFFQVGTAKRAKDEPDDEFDYAFDGGQREGATHKQVRGGGLFGCLPLESQPHFLLNFGILSILTS